MSLVSLLLKLKFAAVFFAAIMGQAVGYFCFSFYSIEGWIEWGVEYVRSYNVWKSQISPQWVKDGLFMHI